MYGSRIASRLAAIGVALLMASGSSWSQSTTTKIKINTAGLVGESPIYLAMDKGYFKAEGLDVELIMAQANSANDTLTLLSNGDLDMGSFALSAGWLNAVDRGLSVVSLMALNTIKPEDAAAGLLVRQDLIESGRYKEPKDLKGMKVAAFSLSGSGHYNILQALKMGGLGANDVELVTLGPPDIITALANKSLDAAFNVDPFITIAKLRNIASMVIADGKTSPGVPSIVLHANKAFAAKNGDAIDRFLTAVLRAQKEYIAATAAGGNREPLIKTLQAHGTIKDEKMLSGIAFPTVDANGRFDLAAFDAQQKFFIETGAMKKIVEVQKIFDFSYLDRAAARLKAQ